MTKEELRKIYLSKRQALSDSEYSSINNSLTSEIWKRIQEIKPHIVHLFLPIKKNKEFDTFPLIKLLLESNIKVVIPVSDFKTKEMRSSIFDSNTILDEKKYGILEPTSPIFIDESTIDLILVPLLVADKFGNRVGYGGGFYDRYLNSNSNIYKLGISFFNPIDTLIPTNEFDVPLDEIISPS